MAGEYDIRKVQHLDELRQHAQDGEELVLLSGLRIPELEEIAAYPPFYLYRLGSAPLPTELTYETVIDARWFDTIIGKLLLTQN